MTFPRPAHVFPNAAVASPHYLATMAGVGVLQAGGNAVDAAIATNLVLAVTCPHLCGVGGDLFAMVYERGRVHGLNSSGRLPSGAELPDDGSVPVHGIGSATVPGAAAGWVALADRFGRMDLSELAQPAIRYAREGFMASPSLVRAQQRSAALFERFPEMGRLFGSEAIRNPELAEVLEDLRGFYKGKVANNAPNPFTPEDFSAHAAEWVDPMREQFAGHTILEMPPNSRGYLVLEALRRLEPLDGLGPQDAEFHLRLIRAITAASDLDADTVYLCAVDEDGMAVSINESNYMGFGSGVVIPGTGVHLHNRGAYFTPDTYKAGARPIHTLSPAMALDGDRLAMVFGTMGGEAQIQIHMQLMARVLLCNEDPADALAAPRWVRHASAQPLMAEPGLPDIGAHVVDMGDHAGHAHMIRRVPGGWSAASDPRCDGLAAGF